MSEDLTGCSPVYRMIEVLSFLHPYLSPFSVFLRSPAGTPEVNPLLKI
jgi:hypothetical protein